MLGEDTRTGKPYARGVLVNKDLSENTLVFLLELKHFLATSGYLQTESKLYLQHEVSYGEVAQMTGGNNSCVTAKITRDAKKINSLFGEMFLVRLLDYKDSAAPYIACLDRVKDKYTITARFKEDSLLHLNSYSPRKNLVSKQDIQVVLGLLKTYRKGSVKSAEGVIQNNAKAMEYILFLLEGQGLTDEDKRVREQVCKVLCI